MKSRRCIIAAALAATSLSGTAFAQDDAANADQLGDIVVTARKSSENLQSVPLSITALSSSALEAANAREIRDVALLTPGLNISGDALERNQQPSIRGLSFTGDGNQEGNVAVLLDGIYMSNSSALSVGLMDFERIEVVKGPQSALYGANAFAGAINYVPKAPPSEFEAHVQARTGTYKTRSVRVSAGGPIIQDILNVRIAGLYDKIGGTQKDDVNRRVLGGAEKKDFSFQARLTPDDRSTYDFGLYYGDDTFGPSIQANAPNNCVVRNGVATILCGEVPDGKNVDFVAPNFIAKGATGQDRKVKHARFKASYDFDAFTVNANLGYFDVKSRSYNELFGLRDGQPFALGTRVGTAFVPNGRIANIAGYAGGETANKDYSAELRVASQQNQPLRWAFGVYYYRIKQDVQTTIGFNSDVIPAGETINCTAYAFACLWLSPGASPSRAVGVSTARNRQASAFGSLAYDVTDRLTLSAEARYTEEVKRSNIFSITTALNSDPDGPDGQRAKFKYWNPRFTANFQATPDHLIYASLAKGTKSGGFNARATIPSELSYDPENNWTYEVGLKNTFFDRRLRVNVAGFYVDWTDLQILVPSATGLVGSVTQNYGGVKAFGGELEIQAQLARGISLNGGLAYTNPKFTKDTYDFSAVNVNNCRLVSSCASRIVESVAPPTGGAAVPAINLDGLLRQQVSRWQLLGGVNINRPLTDDWEWFANANYKYESRQYTMIDDIRYIGPRNTLTAQIGISRENLKFTLWAQNLLNDLTPFANAGGQGISRYNGTAAIPRSMYPDQRRVGLTVDMDF